MPSQNWIEKPKPPVPDVLQQAFPNPIVHTRLAEFGIQTVAQAEAFLNPDCYQPSAPQALPGLAQASHRLWQAIQNKEKIGVWGDFDVDGQTSTTLLVEGLQKLGAQVVYHIPNRDKESHGIRLPYLQAFLKQHITLLITCDTGISEHESIDYATQHGVETIITDHHSLPEILPDAYAIVNPQLLTAGHPLSYLAGVGAAYKVIEAVYELADQKEECEQFLDLVALGTVADVALLQGENRWLVQKGLEKLQSTTRLGLQKIYEIKGINAATLNETHISFMLAPMLNALGRLDDANPIVEFLTTANPQFVSTFATNLNNLNEQRKLRTDQITEAVLAQLARHPHLQQTAGIVVEHTSWHAGILGIVANRIVEQFQKPVILLTGNKESGYRGSGRSIEAVNIIEAIREQQDLLDQYGGHAMAAGVSLPAQALEKFRAGFDRSIRKQIGSQPAEDVLGYDYELDFHQITPQFIDQFSTLRPFGAGNPPFLFMSKSVKVKKVTKIGKAQNHLRIQLTDELNQQLEVLWWRGDTESLPNEEIDILYTLNKSIYMDEERAQVELITFRPSPQSTQKQKTVHQTLTICDLRAEKNPPALPLEDFPDAAIWYEGTHPFNLPTASRLTLGPTQHLIIAFSPPGLREIQKVIQTCRPQTIILYPPHDSPLTLKELVSSVGSMVNYAIQNNQGLIHVEKMAAAIGQRTVIIETTLAYLAAAGKITLKRHPDTDTVVKKEGVRNPTLESNFLNQLIFLHKETGAFQTWYQTVIIDQLKEELFQPSR